MEKFHKYCLSVLLVIISTNISTQISNGTFESEDCKQFCEMYTQLLNYGCDALPESCAKENNKPDLTIQLKQRAIDLLGKITFAKQQNNSYNNTSGADFSEEEKYKQLLKNFEKSTKQNLFTEILYFKTKVSKVRNKDYLELIG